MRRFLIAVAALTAVAGTTPGTLRAQQVNLDISAGQIQSALAPDAGTPSLAAGLRYDDPLTGLRLSAGLPTEDAEPLWASLGGWRRLAAHHNGFVAGIDLSGNAFVTRDRETQQGPIPGPLNPGSTPTRESFGHAIAGQAMPVVGYEGVDVQIHARAGVSTYRAEFDQASLTRTVRAADVQLTYSPTPMIAIMPVARYYSHADEPALTYVGASAVLSQGTASVWGSAGRFVSGVNDDAATSLSGGIMLRLQERLSLQASARRDGFNPLYLTPAQTGWSIGASLLIGGRAGPPPPPVPALYESGRATITLPVSDAATAPSIAGDFNSWSPQPMQRIGDHWSYTVAVAPGVYNYAFVDANGEWFVPESVPGRRDDGMGGHVAVLVVE